MGSGRGRKGRDNEQVCPGQWSHDAVLVQVLASASARRPITLKALVRLVTLLLGIPLDTPTNPEVSPARDPHAASESSHVAPRVLL